MSSHLYVSPAASGKTAWVIDTARLAAQGLQRIPIIVVATTLQARSIRSRLALSGGALGVRVLTFDQLYAVILQQSGDVYTELAEPVRFRLLRTVINTAASSGNLPFYSPLASTIGFAIVVQDLIGLFKGAAIAPERFLATFPATVEYTRLRELGGIYLRYQQLLQAQAWSDREGMAWLALEALQRPTMRWPVNWSPIIFDGFDSFTQVQLTAISALAATAETVVVTLTGDVVSANGEATARPALLHYAATAATLRHALGVRAEPLPTTRGNAAPMISQLTARIFSPPLTPAPVDDDTRPAVTLMEVTDRTGEVRAALRWLKERIVVDHCQLGETALLARQMSAYIETISLVAQEYGLPIRLLDGLPLARNPAVAALLGLLRILLPDTNTGQTALPRRQVIEAWRSPYFDWASGPTGPGIDVGDADLLDAVARATQVIGGEAQWMESLARLATRTESQDYGEVGAYAAAPDPVTCQKLLAKFRAFVDVLAAPTGATTYREFVAWIEDLIGNDIESESGDDAGDPLLKIAPFTLNMISRIQEGAPDLHDRDVTAMRALKEVLRGLVLAEEVTGSVADPNSTVSFGRFYTDLIGAIDFATYHPPFAGDDAIWVGTTLQVRGLPLCAAAIMGLAEGELPMRMAEDPFLRDADRRLLLDAGIPIELSTRSLEREYFYDALARPRDYLLLTRPCIADNGAEWEPSPYWDDVRRVFALSPARQRAGASIPISQAASVVELLELTGEKPPAAVAEWLTEHAAGALDQVKNIGRVLRQRQRRHRHGVYATPFDGNFTGDPQLLADLASSLRRWSASRIEAYRSCPYRFYAASVLKLVPRIAPDEGLDAAQTGTIYHEIFEKVYATTPPDATLEQRLAALPALATQVLDAAPEKLGFRATRWWQQTRTEIEENVRRSLEALAELEGAPIAFEQEFSHEHALRLHDDQQEITLRGFIDRVDRLPDGTLRIVDYKTGVTGYDKLKGLQDGKKLQLPLYALAAQTALGLGDVTDGIYFFAHKAKEADWSLATFPGGVKGAVDTAVNFTWEAVHGAQAGEFAPHPPDDGCPDYCPVRSFCWHYKPA